ncbi:MAG: dihydrofolate reductase family protein [Nitriliruptoraceae bacterium]
MLRRLLPEQGDLSVDDLYAGVTLDLPVLGRVTHVALCMVSSVDGAVAVDGLSGGLGGEADRRSLSRLRASNDVSLVGAGTIRDEGYRPLTGSTARREDRAARGLRPAPRLAIVTGSGQLDPDLAVFDDPDEPPLILTGGAADGDALAAIADRAEVHVVTDGPTLEASALVEALGRLGLPRVLCEGGPRLNQLLLAAGVVDEVFLTLAPLMVGGAAPRIVAGQEEVATPLTLTSVHEHEGELLLRYRRT